MHKATNVLVIVSFLWLLVSFWNRNDLPGSIDYVPSIADEPRQTAARERPFEVNWEDVSYRILPEYAYDLVGMVVSYRHHDDNSRMHRLADDHLNMLDVCVVWGDNTTTAELGKLDFWNGIFTCNVRTRDTAAWNSFNMDQLSNNHLLSDDDDIRDRVRKIRIGDQIRVSGYLASYESPGGLRGTSTTRTDTGDGACETIYVERFEILKAATSFWRLSMWASLAAFLAGLFFFFTRPFKSHLS
ncbi:MAG: hypothetical protein QNJ11_16430 [Woeseiaceae bacterium]|nr:hypothetical protein [Woeseiaceae bacterium]